jgi:hypothetical protein
MSGSAQRSKRHGRRRVKRIVIVVGAAKLRRRWRKV